MPYPDFGPRASRGQLLKGTAGGMAAVAASGSLAGSLGDSSPETSTTEAGAKPKRGGSLRAGLT